MSLDLRPRERACTSHPAKAGGHTKALSSSTFDRAIDTRLFPAGQRFIAEWPTDARDCFEVHEGRPWTFEPDYFGLAGVIF